jgi:vancomycin resistance protein VanW
MGTRKPLSSVNPVFYHLSVAFRRLLRRLEQFQRGDSYALCKSSLLLPCVVAAHRSVLMRKLAGIDQALQRNKIESLHVAVSFVDGVVIEPGEVFSFWKLVGKPVSRRGFPPGPQLSNGELVSMEGGGLCQFSNLLHWMVLHTPLLITERHRHAFDPFPDSLRTVPFGTGATVFYNYLDFMFRNTTSLRFQVKAWLDEEYLNGEIRCGGALPLEFSVEERKHRFIRQGGKIFRENELWRIVKDSSDGSTVSSTMLMVNHSEVLYEVEEDGITSV